MKNAIKKKSRLVNKLLAVILFLFAILLSVTVLLTHHANAQTTNTINTGTFYVSSGTTVAVEGSFTNSSGSSATGAGDIYLKGDWINSGTFLSESGKVVLWGSSSQNIGGANTSDFYDLNINNSSGVTLSKNITVGGTLMLNAGLLTTSANEVDVTNNLTNAINPYSATEYIVGNLRRSVTGTGNYYFPIGTATQYEIGSINFSGMTGISNLLGKFTNSSPGSVPGGLTINGSYINGILDYGYWTFTPDASMTGGQYTVTLGERGASNTVLAANRYGVLKRVNSGNPWQSLGTHTNATQSVSGGTITAARSALTSFSDFSIGYTTSGFPLPVELISFDATLNKDVVDLKWTTLSETNSDYFTIERSADAIHFYEILKTDAAGNSNQQIDYKATDENPLTGTSYYRLKQTDTNGKCTDSLMDDVNYTLHSFSFTVLPNPTTAGNMNLNIRGAYHQNLMVILTDALGKQYFHSTVTPDSDNFFFHLNAQSKPAAGNYVIEIVSNGTRYTKSIVLQ